MESEVLILEYNVKTKNYLYRIVLFDLLFTINFQ